MDKKSQMVNMRYPAVILERIDQFKDKEGYANRTDAILALLRKALEKEGF